jgi:transcriptional regulator with XRE-family HTH domain
MLLSMAKPSTSYAGKPELVALGRVIRELRTEKGYSQESFADEVGIDRSYIGGIERGEHNLALVNLLKISKALKISASNLLGKAKI